jgi:hypothetical protein
MNDSKEKNDIAKNELSIIEKAKELALQLNGYNREQLNYVIAELCVTSISTSNNISGMCDVIEEMQKREDLIISTVNGIIKKGVIEPIDLISWQKVKEQLTTKKAIISMPFPTPGEA